jgi:hypothetical protein
MSAKLQLPLALVLLAAGAGGAAAQAPVRQGISPAPILTCTLSPRPTGTGDVTVTNVGQAPLDAGRRVIISFLQAGSGGGGVYTLGAPLPPGGSMSFPASGASLLARGCIAVAG